jgi:circadian clock protein KaiC
LQIIFTSPQVIEQELRSADSLLLEMAGEIGAKRIFIDGIGLLHQSSNLGTPMPFVGPGSYRELLQQLLEGLGREHLTTMLSQETGTYAEAQLIAESAGFLADTVIRLRRTLLNRRVFRSVEIVKSRGQNYEAGEHTLQINDGKGLTVFRRVQAPFRHSFAQPTSTARRSFIGVEALDQLFGGGVFDGSTTLIAGLSGVGKTILGNQILLESAIKQQKRGLLISLDEHPAQIVRNAETIGLDLQSQIDSGFIHVLFESPQELNIDIHYAKIVGLVEEFGIERMVIDGMTSYSSALMEQSVYRDFVHALVAFSKFRLMTTFFNYENPEFLGLSAFMPDFPVSSIVDNILLLNMVEINSTLRRCATVVKARGSKHEFDSREYVIEQGGIRLLPFEQTTEPKPRPFSTYSSVLSRAPSRFAAAVGSKSSGDGS